MPVLHYGNSEIELTKAEAKSFVTDLADLCQPGAQSIRLEAGFIHLVTGPGIPIWIDDREPAETYLATG